MSEESVVGGVDIVLARMETHPEEFYGEEKKWAFIYKEYFRDVMTEIERGQLFEKLKKIRRQEFNERVFTTLVPPEEAQEEIEYDPEPFGSATIKAEGATVVYDKNKNRVRLTATDVAIANKRGMSLSDYASGKMRMQK